VALLPLATVHPLAAADVAANWWTWWQGDTCGMLIFAPLALSWTARGIVWTRPRIIEAAVFGALLLAAGEIVFAGGPAALS